MNRMRQLVFNRVILGLFVFLILAGLWEFR